VESFFSSGELNRLRVMDLFRQRQRRATGGDPDDAAHPPLRPILYTEPLPLNTNPQVFQYVFGSQCAADFFGSRYVPAEEVIKTMPCHMPWEEARFLLEKKHGLFDIRQRKANLAGAYIRGFLWQPHFRDWRQEVGLTWASRFRKTNLSLQTIPKTRTMLPTDRVIVVVEPLPPGAGLYVPERFRTDGVALQRAVLSDDQRRKEEEINNWYEFLKTRPTSSNPNATEEDKINAIMRAQEVNQALDEQRNRQLRRLQKGRPWLPCHPTDAEAPSSAPPGSICHACGRAGHWKSQCPSARQPQRTTGIPRSLLRDAQTDEERRTAMLTEDGRRVVQITDASLVPSLKGLEFLMEHPDDDDGMVSDPEA